MKIYDCLRYDCYERPQQVLRQAAKSCYVQRLYGQVLLECAHDDAAASRTPATKFD